MKVLEELPPLREFGKESEAPKKKWIHFSSLIFRTPEATMSLACALRNGLSIITQMSPSPPHVLRRELHHQVMFRRSQHDVTDLIIKFISHFCSRFPSVIVCV